jgi:hypothetical protein
MNANQILKEMEMALQAEDRKGNKSDKESVYKRMWKRLRRCPEYIKDYKAVENKYPGMDIWHRLDAHEKAHEKYLKKYPIGFALADPKEADGWECFVRQGIVRVIPFVSKLACPSSEFFRKKGWKNEAKKMAVKSWLKNHRYLKVVIDTDMSKRTIMCGVSERIDFVKKFK